MSRDDHMLKLNFSIEDVSRAQPESGNATQSISTQQWLGGFA